MSFRVSLAPSYWSKAVPVFGTQAGDVVEGTAGAPEAELAYPCLSFLSPYSIHREVPSGMAGRVSEAGGLVQVSFF